MHRLSPDQQLNPMVSQRVLVHPRQKSPPSLRESQVLPLNDSDDLEEEKVPLENATDHTLVNRYTNRGPSVELQSGACLQESQDAAATTTPALTPLVKNKKVVAKRANTIKPEGQKSPANAHESSN